MSTNRTHTIIVNYNAGDWLQRSVNSALKYTDGAVTVVDNASSDSSVVDTQTSYKDVRLNWITNNENLGFAAANNQVLKSLEHEFAILMNPDCELNESSVLPILDAMDADASIGIASGLIYNEDGSIQATCRRQFPTPWSSFVRLFQLHRVFPNSSKFTNFDYGDTNFTEEVEKIDAISGAFMVVRTSALKKVGFLDESYFMHCEDLDWCKRFELEGYGVAFVSAANLIHAKGVSSKARPIRVLYTLHKGMSRFFDKFYKDQTPLIVLLFVKAGIVASFLVRSSISLVYR